MKELHDAARRDERKTMGAGGWRCWLGLHRWARWADPVKIERRKFDGYVNVGVMAQSRDCARCGKRERREVGNWWHR